jgi:uncharacterized protein with beta-barrel porin domain
VGANGSTGTITNNLTWNGAVTTNAGTIINASVATWTGDVNGNANVITNNGTWAGNVGANGSTGTITNNLTWNGAVTTNAGTIINASVATWTGNVNANANVITNNGIWAGNVVSNAGTITNNNTWTGTVSNGGTFNNNAGATVSGLLTNTAGTTINGGALNNGAVISGGSLTTTGTIAGGLTNSALVNARGGSIGGAVANNANGTFNVGGTVTGNSTFDNANGATLAVGGAGNYTLQGLLTNAGAVTVAGGGTLDASAGGVTNNAGGSITVASGGTIRDDLTNAGTITNNGAYFANIASNTGTITNNAAWTGNVLSNTSTIVNSAGANWTGNVSNGGTFTNDGTVTGTLTNTAGTTTNNGSISGAVAVNGGIFKGTGSTGGLTLASGSTFAPGNGTPGTSATINGGLAFQSGAFYLIGINPATSSFASATGAATLGGASVYALFSSGSYVAKQYTILSATGGVSGTFNTLANTNLPSGFTSTLGYDATHAYLNLALSFAPPPNSGLSANQQGIANAIVNFFNTNGGIPIAFGALSSAELTQVAGEVAIGSQQTTFDAMNLFMGVMTDPFVAGRGDGPSVGGGSATGYADADVLGYADKRKPNDALAAIYTKAPAAVPFEQRWSTWVAGYGGSQTTDGNAALGSNSTTSNVYGTAVGADYRFSPFTLAGFALAGGGTNFSVANSGSGHSDLFQAGAFIRHNEGSAYISAALAYGWQDITTNRTVTAAGIDQLRAEFNANAFSGRLEGGYRFVSPWAGGIGLTPYVAAQFTTFDLPAYAEQATVGSNAFALAYDAKDVTDVRSELGIRTDKSWAMEGAILTLRGRFAWAHDFDPDRSIAATFQTLPGASFTVNGAAQAHDSALTTASVEMKWINGWSAAATFEGEFSNVTSSYAGKGVVRYTW